MRRIVCVCVCVCVCVQSTCSPTPATLLWGSWRCVTVCDCFGRRHPDYKGLVRYVQDFDPTVSQVPTGASLVPPYPLWWAASSYVLLKLTMDVITLPVFALVHVSWRGPIFRLEKQCCLPQSHDEYREIDPYYALSVAITCFFWLVVALCGVVPMGASMPLWFPVGVLAGGSFACSVYPTSYRPTARQICPLFALSVLQDCAMDAACCLWTLLLLPGPWLLPAFVSRVWQARRHTDLAASYAEVHHALQWLRTSWLRDVTGGLSACFIVFTLYRAPQLWRMLCAARQPGFRAVRRRWDVECRGLAMEELWDMLHVPFLVVLALMPWRLVEAVRQWYRGTCVRACVLVVCLRVAGRLSPCVHARGCACMVCCIGLFVTWYAPCVGKAVNGSDARRAVVRRQALLATIDLVTLAIFLIICVTVRRGWVPRVHTPRVQHSLFGVVVALLSHLHLRLFACLV